MARGFGRKIAPVAVAGLLLSLSAWVPSLATTPRPRGSGRVNSGFHVIPSAESTAAGGLNVSSRGGPSFCVGNGTETVTGYQSVLNGDGSREHLAYDRSANAWGNAAATVLLWETPPLCPSWTPAHSTADGDFEGSSGAPDAATMLALSSPAARDAAELGTTSDANAGQESSTTDETSTTRNGNDPGPGIYTWLAPDPGGSGRQELTGDLAPEGDPRQLLAYGLLPACLLVRRRRLGRLRI